MRIAPLASLLCAMMLAGCAAGPTGPGAHAGEPYVVNSQRTLFYSFGPAQATGPDFALYHGQQVTMLSYDYGYSHIAIPATGQTGYVATEDLTPAPPGPKPGPAQTASGATHHRHRKGDVADPGGQGQIPLPEFPESEPPPGSPPFRY